MPRGLVVVTLLLAGAPAAGQDVTTGTIAGRVRDAQGGVLPGARATLSSSQGMRDYVSDERGRFLAPFLTPAPYSVRVELSGFNPVERGGVIVRLGQRVELEFTLEIGDRAEALEVVAASPVVDLSSTTVGSILATSDLERLPVGRRFTELLYLAPGVSTTDVGAANPSIAGASGLENHYVLDGVNITHAGYGAVGSYSVIYGSLGSGVTSDFIQQTQVKTAGFEAEYGQTTGGVVNVVTRSGTNTFHGGVFGYLQPAALEAERRQVETPLGTVVESGASRADFGVSLSGPLVSDRLFGFAAFNPQYERLARAAPRGAPLEKLGEVDRERRFLAYAGKLTWHVGSDHRVDVSAFGDPGRGEPGPQRPAALLAADTGQYSTVRFGGHNQVVKYDAILASSWLLEATLGRAGNVIEESPEADERRVNDLSSGRRVVSGGLGFHEVGNDSENRQLAANSTHLFEAAGSHQLRYGVQLERIRYDNPFAFTGPSFTFPDGTRTISGVRVNVLPAPELPSGRLYNVSGPVSPTTATSQRYTSFFVQDTWRVGRLTLRPGLRYDRQTLIGGDAPESLVCHENDSRPGAGDGSGELIPCQVTFSGNWAPRLGATWDPKGDGKVKLYASWGRFFAKIPNDLAVRGMSAFPGLTAEYYDAELTQPIPNDVLAGPNRFRHFVVDPGDAADFDPEAHSTFLDELVAGLEIVAARNLNLGLRYVYRDMPRVLEDVGLVSLTEFLTHPNPFEFFDYFLTNPDADTPVHLGEGRFEKPIHRYHALELTATRSFSDGWGVLASYRWSRLSGTFEGFFRSDNGQSNPAISSLYDFPTDDPSYAALAGELGLRGDIRYLGGLGQGPLPNDRTHQVKLYASLSRGPFNLGLGWNASSGRPLTPMAANAWYNNAGEIPEGPRGSGIETSDDGFRQRSPLELRVDLHADWTLTQAGWPRLVLVADAFNLFDRQRPTNYDYATELSFGVPNPNFGAPTAGAVSSFSSLAEPRQTRVGLRFEW